MESGPLDDGPPTVRVLMAACNDDGSPRLFFHVNLLLVEDWIASGYRPVMFDPDDWFAFIHWQAARH